mmetsp:Transcript_53093/g.125418  ORF Transcript_53093/g.125418 Transcript_53093/m.125418 type:complete len:319 (+) Transcript_53093:324-1280(+)
MKEDSTQGMLRMGNQAETEEEAQLREQMQVMEYIQAQKAKLIAERQSAEQVKKVQAAGILVPEKVSEKVPEGKKIAEAKKAVPVEVDPVMEAEMLREQEQMVALLAKERDRRAKSRAADAAFSHLLQQPLVQLLENEDSVARSPSTKGIGHSVLNFSGSQGQFDMPDETWGDKAPAGLVCPLTLELMVDPVSTCDGQSYERKHIEEWLRNNDTSPLTNKKLEHKHLTPNIALRRTIEEWNTTRAQRLLAATSPKATADMPAEAITMSAAPRGAMEISVFSPVKTISEDIIAQKSTPSPAAGREDTELNGLQADKLGFA